MSATSKIQWTDKTWNPTRGCSIVSPGCINCYAMKQAHRFSGPGGTYEGLTKRSARSGPQWTGKVVTVEDALLEPLSWRKPQRVFVNSMSDLFHEDVPDAFIDKVFAVMSARSVHAFQILTKRAERMRAYMADTLRHDTVIEAWSRTLPRRANRTTVEHWPLPNVWLGTSVENQQYADERIPLLLQTPAAVRFISAEPLLGPVDIGLASATCACCTKFASRWIKLNRPVYPDFPLALLPEHKSRWHDAGITRAASNGHGALSVYTPAGLLGVRPSEFEALPKLDWVIVGGESGPGARPFDLAWARSIVEQCKAAGVACFVKQLGAIPIQPCSQCGRTAGKVLGGMVDACGPTHAAVIAELQRIMNTKGGDPSEWTEDLRVRQFPT